MLLSLRVGNNRLIYLTFFSVSTGYPHRSRITQYYDTCKVGVVHRRNIHGAMENVTGLWNYPEGRGVRALEWRVSCALRGDCPLKVRRAATPYQCAPSCCCDGTKQILVFALFWFWLPLRPYRRVYDLPGAASVIYICNIYTYIFNSSTRTLHDFNLSNVAIDVVLLT